MTLNFNRILCRLRSRHAKLRCNFKKDKLLRPKVIPQLADLLCQVTKFNSSAGADISSLTSEVENLVALFSDVESANTFEERSQSDLNTLISIVTTAHKISHRSVLHDVLGPVVKLNRVAISRLSSVLLKLGRYQSVASNLHRAAREYSIFTTIKIETVKLSPLPELIYENSDSLITRLMYRSSKENKKGLTKSSLETRLRITNEQEAAQVEYDLKQIASAVCPVHAEIQLLFHYELYNPTLLPRVICSTKKACFLCNLFFRLHGKFFIPSSHGKLYVKWAIPETMKCFKGDQAKRMASCITRLNETIEETIRSILDKGFKAHPAPNESAIFQSAIWSASARSRSRSTPSLASTTSVLPDGVRLSTLQDICKTERASSNSNVQHLPGYTQDVDKEGELGSLSKSTAGVELTGSNARTATDLTNRQSTEACHDIPQLRLRRLERGLPIQLELQASDQPWRIESRRIHLILAYESCKTDLAVHGKALHGQNLTQTDEKFQISLKWLKSEEHAQVIANGANLIDLDCFVEGSEVVVDQYLKGVHTGLHVCRKSEMIFIQCWRTDETLKTQSPSD